MSKAIRGFRIKFVDDVYIYTYKYFIYIKSGMVK